jgi:myo-inositol-1(or 4)-monophosphatase
LRASDAPWGPIFAEASRRTQELVSGLAISERGRVIGVGASGDKTLLVDKVAEDEMLMAVADVEGLRILSEEAGTSGNRTARTLMVLDPLDGSANFERGIPFYCTAVAVAEGERLDDIVFGLVRDLVSGDVYSAVKGGGATKNGTPIRASGAVDPAECVVDIDMSRGTPELVAGLGELVRGIRRQVHYGANALEMCLLADGRFDAFVDLRGKMRVTDFAAPYLISKESGAKITEGDGSPLNPALDLAERFSFVAAGNPTLHGRILALCRKGNGGDGG